LPGSLHGRQARRLFRGGLAKPDPPWLAALDFLGGRNCTALNSRVDGVQRAQAVREVDVLLMLGDRSEDIARSYRGSC